MRADVLLPVIEGMGKPHATRMLSDSCHLGGINPMPLPSRSELEEIAMLKFVAAAAALVASVSAHANLVAHDSGFGASTIIEDTVTGLSYARLDLTYGMSYMDVLGQTDHGGTFAGFHIASFAEMASLLANVVPIVPGDPATNQFYGYQQETDPATVFRAISFTTLFGVEPGIRNDGEYGASFVAHYGDPLAGWSSCASINCVTHTAGVFWTLGPDTTTGGYYDGIAGIHGAPPGFGTLLVLTPVPEPETYTLMLAGLVGVGAMVRRRSQAPSETRQLRSSVRPPSQNPRRPRSQHERATVQRHGLRVLLGPSRDDQRPHLRANLLP
jgi:hypothetical protein